MARTSHRSSYLRKNYPGIFKIVIFIVLKVYDQFCEIWQITGHLCALHLRFLSIWRSTKKLVCIQQFPAQNSLSDIGHGGPWCSFLLIGILLHGRSTATCCFGRQGSRGWCIIIRFLGYGCGTQSSFQLTPNIWLVFVHDSFKEETSLCCCSYYEQDYILTVRWVVCAAIYSKWRPRGTPSGWSYTRYAFLYRVRVHTVWVGYNVFKHVPYILSEIFSTCV